MTIQEDFLDTTRQRQFQLLRFDASLRRAADETLAELERELSTLVASTEFGVRASTVKSRQEQLLKDGRDAIRTSYSKMAREHLKQLDQLSSDEIDWVNESTLLVLGAAGVTALKQKTIPMNEIKGIVDDSVIQGRTMKQWWSQIAGGTVEAFNAAIREGVSLGEQGTALAQRIKGGTRQGEPIIGMMQRAQRNAHSIIRTGTQMVANKARLLAYKANPNVKGVTQISVFDSRTSKICIAYGGRKWDLDLKPIGHNLKWLNGPPRHINCRSSAAPLYDLDEDVDDKTFDVWLKGKNKKFQNELLGVGRAELWRDDKITLTELVNPIGRPLTLDQLKELNSIT